MTRGGVLNGLVYGKGDDDSSNFLISIKENEGGEPNKDQYLTLTAKPGVTVTGIVMKGGNGFNVYVPGEKGLEEAPGPWEKLYAPLNKGGNIPQISHWYACGEAEEVVETPTSTPTTTTPDVRAATRGDKIDRTGGLGNVRDSTRMPALLSLRTTSCTAWRVRCKPPCIAMMVGCVYRTTVSTSALYEA
jgi:hypothetical protein